MRNILLIISCMLSLSIVGQTSVSADLDTTAIRIGEQAKIKLQVEYSGKTPQVIWPSIKDTLQRHVEVVDPGMVDTFHVGSSSRQIQELTITSWDSGYWAIPPFKFIIDGKEVDTEAFLFSVNTVEVDTTAAPMPIKPLMQESFSLVDWFKLNWIYLFIALGAIILFIVLIKIKPREAKKVSRPKGPLQPVHILALERLEEMKLQEHWKNRSSKEYFTDVTDVVRTYLEERFGINAMEQTTSEIMNDLKYTAIDDQLKNELRAILMRADMAKFAKEQSSESMKSSVLDQALTLVKRTKMSPAQLNRDNE